MAAASRRRESTCTPWAFQYCRSMEMDADPQPSSLCWTNGTSSQIPALSWDAARGARPRTSARNKPRTTFLICVTSDSGLRRSTKRDREHDNGNRDQDDPQHIAVGNTACRKIALRLARPLGQFGKVFVAQLAYGLVYFLVVQASGFEGLLALVGRKQRSYSFLIGLTGLGR